MKRWLIWEPEDGPVRAPRLANARPVDLATVSGVGGAGLPSVVAAVKSAHSAPIAWLADKLRRADLSPGELPPCPPDPPPCGSQAVQVLRTYPDAHFEYADVLRVDEVDLSREDLEATLARDLDRVAVFARVQPEQILYSLAAKTQAAQVAGWDRQSGGSVPLQYYQQPQP